MILFKILLSGCCNKDYSTLFTPLMHCLLIYYTCDVNICVENGYWHTYAMHSVLPSEPGETPSQDLIGYFFNIGLLHGFVESSQYSFFPPLILCHLKFD
jgi:hypothetical protein